MQSVKKKVTLCGFMGAGKSHFLQKLQNTSLPYQFKDLDEEVFKGQGSGYNHLGELIEEMGWDAFRHLEYDFLKDLIVAPDNMVIALGGGAFNQNLLEQSISIWLNTPFEVCFARIRESKERPLIKLSKEELQNLYQEREFQYKKCKYILKPEEMEQITSLEDLFSSLGLQ